jgi:hypothetical protein
MMDSWKFESNSGKQTALSLVCVVIGLVLAFGFRNFSGAAMPNSLAGFLLGLLLLLIGISAFLANGKQTIVVDPKARHISIADTNHFRTKKRLIAFSDIVDTYIGYFGKASNYFTFYYVVLKLRSGEEVTLFSPGYFYDGGSDRSVMESRRQGLEECLKH